MLKLIAPLSLSALVVLTACTTSITTPNTPTGTGTPGTGTPVANAAPSFKTDVAPLLAQTCAGCHAKGKDGEFDLLLFDSTGQVSYSAARASAGSIVRQVSSGAMPKTGAKLTTAQIALIRAWQASGSLNN